MKTSRSMVMWRLVLPNNFLNFFSKKSKRILPKIIHAYVLLKNSSSLLWLKPSFYIYIIHKCKGTPCLKVSKEIYFLTKTFFWDVEQSTRLCVFFCKFWINIKHVHHLNYMKTLKISFGEHFFGIQICVGNYVLASYFVMQKGHVILWLVCVFHQSFSRCLVNNIMFCNLASHTLFISQ